MIRRTTWALAALLLAAGCSNGDDEASPDPDVAEALDAAGIPPEPDQATADAYIAALDVINPGIVHRSDGRDEAGDIEQAIDRGRDQCSTIQAQPGDRARQIEATELRFTSPDAPEGWGPAVAEQILDVVHQHLCPDY